MSPEEVVKSKLQDIAKNIDKELPDGFGFCLLAFKFDAKPNTSEMMYVSNSDRQDNVRAMEEWIQKTKNNYGNYTKK